MLESCAGTMVKASHLKYVPVESFADEKGIPFTLNDHTSTRYLSLAYPAWIIEAMTSIGLSQLSSWEFLKDLNSTIAQHPIAFRTKSATWHSQLAGTLVKLATDAEHLSMIQDMCLIPLDNGTWTSAKGQSIFFSKGEASLEIPTGIEVLVVDSSAQSDPDRCKLLTALGVKSWEAPEICRLILKTHESSRFDPKLLTVDELVSHAAFLYNASWQPPKTADLWFATVKEERCLGRKLYIPGSIESDSPATRIFKQLQRQFAVIHSDYFKAFAPDASWSTWFVGNLGLSMVPRLISPYIDPIPRPVQAPDLLSEFDWDAFVDSEPVGQDSAPSESQPLTMQSSGHALDDYQMQLMLLEQQNKKRLLMARSEENKMLPSIIPLSSPKSAETFEIDQASKPRFADSRIQQLTGLGQQKKVSGLVALQGMRTLSQVMTPAASKAQEQQHLAQQPFDRNQQQAARQGSLEALEPTGKLCAIFAP